MSSSAEERARANESWWKSHGGAEWRQELDRRRPYQRHYAQQETFLAQLFKALAPARILDYGCGFGRHERYLRDLPGIELHGCDISQKMIEEAEKYVGDAEWVRNRIKLIEPGKPLPYPDGFFDVVFTSEVLINVATEDVQGILKELRRVARRLVFNVENVRVEGSRRQNDEHDGCWLHDFVQLWSSLGQNDVQVLSGLIEHQDIYLVPLAQPLSPDELARISAEHLGKVVPSPEPSRQAADANILVDAHLKNTELALERDLLAVKYREQKYRADALELAVVDFQASTAFKLATRARQAMPYFDLARRVAKGAVKSAESVGLLNLPVPTKGSPQAPLRGELELPFGGFATRASEPTPEDLLALKPRSIAVCHPEWRGIRAATYGQGAPVVEVPEIESDVHLDLLVRFLVRSGAETVVLNGIPPGILRLPGALKRRKPSMRVLTVFHGSSAQHVSQPDEAVMMNSVAELAEKRVVDRIGFVKQGMAESFRALGVPAMTVMNRVKVSRPGAPAPYPADGRVHLGVFMPALWHKNINTQLLAAAQIPGAVVHVNQLPKTPYLHRSRAEFVEHGMLAPHEFHAVLGRMHANLYVSLTECYPMTPLESLAMGVPCITSHTSALFDQDPALFKDLVVTAHDNPAAIAARLLDVLARRDEIVARAAAYLDKLEAQAVRRWEEFLAP